MQHSEAPPIREIPVADKGAGPYGITAGPDGALWLTFAHSGQIARLTTDGELKEYPLDSPTCRPTVITSGPDGHYGSPGPRITRSAASPSTAARKPSGCRRPEADPSASPPAQATCCGSRR